MPSSDFLLDVFHVNPNLNGVIVHLTPTDSQAVESALRSQLAAGNGALSGMSRSEHQGFFLSCTLPPSADLVRTHFLASPPPRPRPRRLSQSHGSQTLCPVAPLPRHIGKGEGCQGLVCESIREGLFLPSLHSVVHPKVGAARDYCACDVHVMLNELSEPSPTSWASGFPGTS